MKAAKAAKADEDTASVVSSVSSTTSFATNSSATTTATTATTASSGAASGGGRSGGQRRRRATYDLVVRNVSDDTDELVFETIFGRFGVVVDVRKVHPKTKVRKVPKKVQALKTSSADLKSTLPLVYVSFADQACADEARQATDGRRMDGMVWEVEWANAKAKGKR